MKETARKHSKKRDDILEALRSTKTHPSAESLYTALKPQHPDLSLGTVYRNLALFVESGEAVSVGTVDGQERFDADTAPHPHFVCERCHRVIDLDLPYSLPDYFAEIEKKTGFSVTGGSVAFTGLCAECINKQTK